MSGIEGPIVGLAGEVIKAAGEGQRAKAADLRKVAAENGTLDPASTIHATSVALGELLRYRGVAMFARLTGVVSQETVDEITEALVDQLRQIPEERRQQPKPSVALPAIEAMAYSWDEQQLRDMYLNLIRRAADSESADAVHPSFVDAIRHLGPEEAVVLDEVLRHEALWPAARIMLRDPETQRFRVTCPVTLPLIVRPQVVPRVLPHLPSWVENWSRLGFVRVDFGAQPVATNGSSIDPFFWVGARPEWFEAQRLASEAVEGSSWFGWVPDLKKGTLDVTPLGRDFLQIVG